jgi:hypothetical protein
MPVRSPIATLDFPVDMVDALDFCRRGILKAS